MSYVFHEANPEPALVLYAQPGRLLYNVIVAYVFTAAALGGGIWMMAAASSSARWGWGIPIVVFGLLMLIGAVWTSRLWNDSKRQARPSVRVTSAGITVITSATRASFVPWEQIQRFTINRVNGADSNYQIAVRDRKAITTPPPATRPAGLGQIGSVRISQLVGADAP